MVYRSTKSTTITAHRVARLFRLLQFLAAGPKTRNFLIRYLKVDTRSFYRDLEVLRVLGVGIRHESQRYMLRQSFDESLSLLPCPDPGLSVQEAILLSKGSSNAHRKLKRIINQLKGKKTGKK